MSSSSSYTAPEAARALVCLRDPSGREHVLGQGDLIGRLWTAALPVNDPRVSEAHAMVSLRGGELWLLALRRRFALGGQPMGELRLEQGQVIYLADDLALEVLTVELPTWVLGVELPLHPPVVLPALCSVRTAPEPRLYARFEPDAPCHIWSDGERWMLSLRGARRSISVGDQWVLDGIPMRAVAMPLSGSPHTRAAGGVDPVLRIIAAFDTVTIQRGEESAFVIGGVLARILSELCALGGPASWEVVAREVWPEEVDTPTLRGRWDVALSRLRARLRALRVRPDLVSADHAGQVQIVLREGDVLEDHT